MADLNPFTIQHVTPGVVRECSADGSLYIFNIANNHPVTVRSWIKNVKEVLTALPPKHICFLMHDLHNIEPLPLDKSITDQFDQLFAFRPDVERYVAYVSPNADMVMQLFIRAHGLHMKSSYCVHWKLFDTRRKALNWLLTIRNERP